MHDSMSGIMTAAELSLVVYKLISVQNYAVVLYLIMLLFIPAHSSELLVWFQLAIY